MNFKNRIVGSGSADPFKLLPNPKNFRKHPRTQNDALLGALQEVGWIQQVIVNRTTGNLVDGHLRVELAKFKKETEIPVLYVELSAEEESLALATLDPISAMAQTDKAQLEALLNSIGTDNEQVKEFIKALAKREGVNLSGEPIPDAPVVGLNEAEALRQKWGTDLGQVWQLGKHRIICGDCRDRAVVEKVMDGRQAVCMWTDPPYGVDYAAKNASLIRANKGRLSEDEIRNDGAKDLPGLLAASFALADMVLKEGSPIYISHPPGKEQVVFDSQFQAVKGWHFHQTLVWVKQTMVIGHNDYQNQHEPIIYGWKGKKRYWYSGRDQVSVLAIDRKMKNGQHPTMKPVELVEVCLRNSTRKGDIVYEPFSGSGTTILACERLKRKCRAIELAPEYVAVALQRWHEMTGEMPAVVV